jgi:hypothetical protein
MLDRGKIEELILESLAEEGVTLSGGNRDLSALKLIGAGALLKSVALVALLVGVEQRLWERCGVEISLMDEHAMSQSRSPFRNVETLASYIQERASSTQ